MSSITERYSIPAPTKAQRPRTPGPGGPDGRPRRVAGQAGWQYSDMSQVHRLAELTGADFAAAAQAPAAVGEYVPTATPVGRK